MSGVDLHEEQRCSQNHHHFSIPAKLSINGPPRIISGQGECADLVNGRGWSQAIIMLEILTFQKDKTYSPYVQLGRSLAEV